MHGRLKTIRLADAGGLAGHEVTARTCLGDVAFDSLAMSEVAVLLLTEYDFDAPTQLEASDWMRLTLGEIYRRALTARESRRGRMAHRPAGEERRPTRAADARST
jgi:hypothetical protein